MAAVVDDGAERSKPDTAGDEEHIMTDKFRIHRERLAVGSSYRYLLTDLHGVEPLGDAAAFLYGKFHIFFVCGRGGYGEHSLADTGNREHGALTGLMLKSLFAVGSYHAEGLDIGRIYADIRHYADSGNKRFSHLSHFSLLLTFSLP